MTGVEERVSIGLINPEGTFVPSGGLHGRPGNPICGNKGAYF